MRRLDLQNIKSRLDRKRLISSFLKSENMKIYLLFLSEILLLGFSGYVTFTTRIPQKNVSISEGLCKCSHLYCQQDTCNTGSR